MPCPPSSTPKYVIPTGAFGIDIAHLASDLLPCRLRDSFSEQLSPHEVIGAPTDVQGADTGIDGYINFFDPADKTPHHRMVARVERRLELNKEKVRCSAGLRPASPAAAPFLHQGKLRAALQSRDLEPLEREIASTDAAIDALAYEFYGITDQERTIIENTECRAGRPFPGVLSPVPGTSDAGVCRRA